ncbi:hypothetical protein ACFLTH_08345 [Bacteroidota bacterium]
MKKIILAIIVTILSVSYNNAQNNTRHTDAAIFKWKIYDKVKSVVGDSSHVISAIEIGKTYPLWYDIGDFENLNGTLTGCILFSGGPNQDSEGFFTPPGNYWVGVLKESQLIWLSEPAYKVEELEGQFENALDMNNDGVVELIHTWRIYDMLGPTLKTYLHIISWDGHNGIFLNEGGLDSKINYRGHEFEILDLNGDNVLEIVVKYKQFNETTFKYDSLTSVYCWNGSYYGEWSDCPELRNSRK